jgi:hypothetical protein
MNQAGQEEAPELPPGMSPEQAEPPSNLSTEPVGRDEVVVEEEAPEQ